MPLSGLTGLRDLRLSSNWISDVTALSGLTGLTSLWLDRNSVSDVTALSGLTNLSGLRLWDNRISDVTSLAGLTSLTGLSLGNNEISNIAPLTGLTSLSSLDLRGNPLNYEAAGNIETLRSSGVKSIYFTPTADDVPIQDALLRERINKQLGSGRAADAVITSAEMLSLTRLNARGSRGSWITDLRGLSYAVNLTRLDLADNNVTDVSPLSGLTKLEHLYFAGNHNLSDITALSGLSELYYLDIWRSRVSDLSVLSNFKKLGRLQARATGITDVSVVEGLPEYYIFALGYNGIRDLAPFVANSGVGWWDAVYLLGNPLSYDAIYSQIPVLKARGTQVTYTNREPGVPVKSSGDAQTGAVSTTLASPLVVQVKDTASSPKPFEAVPITWAVTGGGGSLQNVETKTDVNGLASAELLLGSGFGANTVTASLSHNGTTRTLTFTATADPLVQVQEGEGEGDDGGDDEPVVVPRTPAVRDAIDNLLGSTAQWDNAKDKLKGHNDLTGILVASRKLLNHALDDNSEEYLEGKINGVLGSVPVSNPAAAIRVLTDVIHTVKDAVDDWKIREVLAANNDEIRAHTNSERVQGLVNAINTTYAAYAERWDTLNDRYLKHLPDGHGDKRDYVKRSNDEADKWVRPGAAVNFMMSCYNGCGVTFLTGSSFAGEEIKSSTRAFELARDGHKTGICNVKPHVNLRYYVCRGGSCPRSEEHSAPRPRPVPAPAPAPVRQTQAAAAERQPPAELKFKLDPCEDAMPYPGKLYEINLKVENLGSKGKIEASLSDVTNWRGNYGNYPLATGKPSRDYDLKLLESDNDSKWDAVGTDGLKLQIENTTANPISFDGKITVRCYDSAAYGVLTVKATSPYPVYRLIREVRKIPCDANANQISDAWSHDASYPTFASAIDEDSDVERGPSGNSQHGDGFTAFEEYRGFKTGSGAEPTRLDPTLKEVFIVVDPALSSSGIGPGIGHATRLETDATIKPVTVDSAYVNDWDKNGLRPRSTFDMHGLMNINNNEPICRVRKVYAIRLISNSGSKINPQTGLQILGEVAVWPPHEQSLVQIYVNSATAAQLPFVIAHEIGHAVNLDHCPGSEYPNFPSRSPLPACLMAPVLSSTAVYGSAHNVDYDLVSISSTSRRKAPQPEYVVSPTPSSGGGSGGGSGGSGGGSGGSGNGGSGGSGTSSGTVRCLNAAAGNTCTQGGYASSARAHVTTCPAGHTHWGCFPPHITAHANHRPTRETVTCERCGVVTSQRDDHRQMHDACNGHYYSCNSAGVARHETTYTCTRPGCGSTFTRCTMDTGSARSCSSNGRNYRWHSR